MTLMSVDLGSDGTVFIGSQDNGAARLPGNGGPWLTTSRTDGGMVRLGVNRIYQTFGGQTRRFWRMDVANNSWVSRTPTSPGGWPFYPVFDVLPRNRNNVILGAKGVVWETLSGGDRWEQISRVGAGAGMFPAEDITALAFGPTAPVAGGRFRATDSIYAGLDSGRLFRTDNDNYNLRGQVTTWTELPHPWGSRTVSSITTDWQHPGRVYVTIGEFAPVGTAGAGADMVFYSDNYGNTWNDLSQNLPENSSWDLPRVPAWTAVLPLNNVRDDQPFLYVGNDLGVYQAVLHEDGIEWSRTADGDTSLPNVRVTDLRLQTREGNNAGGNVRWRQFAVATYGRGAWLSGAVGDLGVLRGDATPWHLVAFTDPDDPDNPGDFAASIDWGNGETSSALVMPNDSGGFDVVAGKAYATDGTYDVSVTVTNETDGYQQTFNVSLDVEDEDLQADGVTTSAVSGVSFSGTVATFTDPSGSQDVGLYPALIDWGDGSDLDDGATVVANGDGTFSVQGSHTYAAGGDYIVQVVINHGTTDGATVFSTVHVTNLVNDPPTAVDDTFTGLHDQDTYFDGVLTNDTDANGDLLTAVLVSGPAHGTLNLYGDGSFDYTPNPGYTGQDSFTYQARDGQDYSSTATVTLTITNAAPVAADDGTYTVVNNSALTVTADGGVLANDTDANGDALTAVLVSNPSHGTVTLNPDGSFTYTPASDYLGPDSFTYQANDGPPTATPPPSTSPSTG
jgi:hypothetical protein